MPAAIPWHRRLEARVLIGVTAIIGISLTALALVTGEVVSRFTLERAEGELASAEAAFTNLVTTRASLVGAQTRLITGLPVFRAHMTDSRLARDLATMESMAEMYRQELEAAFTIVSDGHGVWLANTALPRADRAAELEALVFATARGRAQQRIIDLDNRLYLVVAEPAMFADEVLGTLTTGYALNDAMARQLAQTTAHDVAFVTGSAISGTSLAPAPRMRLVEQLRDTTDPLRPEVVRLLDLGNQQYVTAAFPVSNNAGLPGSGRLVLLASWAPTQAFITQIRHALLLTGAVVFALALAAALFVSRRLSRPLRELADAADEIARGRWDRHVTPRGSAEAAALADAFNQMSAGLQHWHDEARAQAAQLQASYDRFFAVTQSVHDPIVSTDASGAIIFWHPRAEELFGFAEYEALGRLFSSLLAPGCQDRYTAAIAGLARGGDRASQALNFEGEGIRANGTAFPIELTVASWQSNGSRCYTAVIRDVTERRRAEEELRLRDQQLREAQKMDAIGRLASGIAHDFNNSLMVIQGHAEMLLLNLPEHDPRRKKVDVIIQSSNGAAAITRRLLTFGRKQVSDVRVVDAREHVASVQKVLGRLLGDDIAVVSDVEANIGHIRIDPDQLDQVIMNLAINARDAMEGGGELRFEVRNTTLDDPDACQRLSLPAGNYVSIAVRDTGCGMPPDTASRIFEPFFTTKEAGRGTGLGLSIVAGIVTQSQGRIAVETEVGRGTTFLLYFPRVDAKSDAAARPVSQAPSLDRGSETVLIAEDKALVRRILRTALEKAGYTVLEAPDGEQALELARTHEGAIDLLLTDVVMPGTGGYALYEALATLRPETRVIFMTGHPPGAVAREAVDRSGAPCLQKPFSFDVLSREMRSVLDAGRAAA